MKRFILVILFVPLMSVFVLGQTSSPATNNSSPQKKEITLSADIVKKYAGVYQLDENFKVTISVEKDKLFALAPGDQEKTEFVPTSETTFYMQGSGAEIEFIEENGIKYLLVKMQQVMKLKKIS